MEENPEAAAAAVGIGAIAKIFGKEWAELSSDENKKYEVMNAEDKARYAEEMAAYSPAE
jgi:hypothetical protein